MNKAFVSMIVTGAILVIVGLVIDTQISETQQAIANMMQKPSPAETTGAYLLTFYGIGGVFIIVGFIGTILNSRR